jgi:dihydrofolate synthase / folylpolyglutamate synthase
MLSYSTLIKKLFQVNVFGGMKLGLENMHRLLKECDSPDQAFRSIHVAGSNGKGSVTTKIASALQFAGYRVGLYTSPHIACFRERIRVNNQMIGELDVQRLLSQLFQIKEAHQIPATFFELATTMAFLYFKEQKVDFAVLETGLGGRLDATNVITPELSIITSISLDHTEILGETIEAIAMEKAGIIKSSIPVIIGPHVPFDIIQQVSLLHHSPLIQVENRGALFDEENSSIARRALQALAQKFVLSDAAIEKGLLERPHCRLQKIELEDNAQIIYLDVAHNPDGLEHLFQALRKIAPNTHFTILFGLSKTKDVQNCLKIISSNGEMFFPVEALNGRGVQVELLREGLLQLKVNPSSIYLTDSINESLSQAIAYAKQKGHILVVCGSFFIMRGVRRVLGIDEAYDEIDLNER